MCGMGGRERGRNDEEQARFSQDGATSVRSLSFSLTIRERNYFPPEEKNAP
ncbi:hypothetical protein X777_06277 [Ooceraea biroi]|uniref:Uncharacterized protein n=1 Tax=Ooceraea biroi TaxID=2015173 RepID=A0A026WB82_OOCBI|nr:hypothetical protein X777_06277 [Ooceraea biroi]